jgi:small subunit ribosomal protein S6
MRDYEMLYILNPELGEESLPAAIDKVNNLVTRLGGEIGEVNSSAPWGKRRMTYQLNKSQDGFYVLANFRLLPARTDELESDLRIYEEVLRHMLISLAKD